MSVFLIEPSPVTRRGLSRLLHGDEVFELLGSAATLVQALLPLRKAQPDVVVIEPIGSVRKPSRSAFRKLKEVSPHSKLVVLSIDSSQEYARRVVEDGAEGFVSKGARLGQILRAIQAVGLGQSVIVGADIPSGDDEV
jgi:DNA-binding NarL/FixJ family response regulator